MLKRTITIYTLFSIVYLVLVTSIFVIQIIQQRDVNTFVSQNIVDTISDNMDRYHKNKESLDTDMISQISRQAFHSNQFLEILVIYSNNRGIQYLQARDSRYVNEAILKEKSLEGIPAFDYNTLKQQRFSGTFTVPGWDTFTVETIQTILPNNDLFKALGLVVILVSGFIVLTLIFTAGVYYLHTRGLLEKNKSTIHDISPKREPTNQKVSEEDIVEDTEEAVSAVLLEPFTGDSRSPDRTHNNLVAKHLEEASRENEDLSLGVLYIEGIIPDTAQYRAYSDAIANSPLAKHNIESYADDTFLVLFKNTNIDSALAETNNLAEHLKNSLGSSLLPFHMGITSRNSRILDSDIFIKEAFTALSKARKLHANAVIGFSPDPEKYRSYLTEKTD